MDSYKCHISKALEIRACSSLLETTLHKHFEAEKTKCSSEINFFPNLCSLTCSTVQLFSAEDATIRSFKACLTLMMPGWTKVLGHPHVTPTGAARLWKVVPRSY